MGSRKLDRRAAARNRRLTVLVTREGRSGVNGRTGARLRKWQRKLDRAERQAFQAHAAATAWLPDPEEAAVEAAAVLTLQLSASDRLELLREHARWIVEIKKPLAPTDVTYLFTDPKFIGKSFVLDDVTMYVRREE